MRAGISCVTISAALLAVGCATASAQSAGISDGVVKIGVLTDMTGVFSDLAGAGSVTAAQMAIDDFVEKEKPSFKVELVSADHLNKPDVATGIARQWYDTGNVDMITDVINSGVALAVSNVAESKNRVLIVTGSGSTRLTNEQCSPNTISYTWDTYSFANGQSRIVRSLGLDTWYFVAVDYALGKSLVAEASDAIARSGGKVMGSIYHHQHNRSVVVPAAGASLESQSDRLCECRRRPPQLDQGREGFQHHARPNDRAAGGYHHRDSCAWRHCNSRNNPS